MRCDFFVASVETPMKRLLVFRVHAFGRPSPIWSGTSVATFLVGGLFIFSSLSAQDSFLSEEELFDEELEEVHSVPDPLEGLNRSIFKFNDFFYMKLLGPVAHVYHEATPDPIENGFSNFFDNVKFPVRLAGNLLQLKVEESFQETGKFLVNSTLGVGGFHKASDQFDGLNPPVEDIGQAFGAWGFRRGLLYRASFPWPEQRARLCRTVWRSLGASRIRTVDPAG